MVDAQPRAEKVFRQPERVNSNKNVTGREPFTHFQSPFLFRREYPADKQALVGRPSPVPLTMKTAIYYLLTHQVHGWLEKKMANGCIGYVGFSIHDEFYAIGLRKYYYC